MYKPKLTCLYIEKKYCLHTPTDAIPLPNLHLGRPRTSQEQNVTSGQPSVVPRVQLRPYVLPQAKDALEPWYCVDFGVQQSTAMSGT